MHSSSSAQDSSSSGIALGPSPAIPSPIDDLGSKKDEIKAQLRREKSGGRYYDLVPKAFHVWVRNQTDKAAPQFGLQLGDPEYAGLLDTMAENWLIKTRLFEHCVTTLGMEEPKKPVGIMDDTPIFGLTCNGSLLFLSEPQDAAGNRDARYDRIDVREPTSIKKWGRGCLASSVSMGDPISVLGYIKQTSPLMDLRIKPGNYAGVRETVVSLSKTFADLDGESLASFRVSSGRRDSK